MNGPLKLEVNSVEDFYELLFVCAGSLRMHGATGELSKTTAMTVGTALRNSLERMALEPSSAEFVERGRQQAIIRAASWLEKTEPNGRS